MLGLFLIAGSFVAATVTGIKTCIYNHASIKDATEQRKLGNNETNTYIDYNGNRRDLDTRLIRNVDPIVVETYGKDRCIRDKYGNVVRNMSQENRDAQYEQTRLLRDPSTTVVPYKIQRVRQNMYCNSYDGEYYEGTLYKDLRNGELLLCRRLVIGTRDFQSKRITLFDKGTPYENPNSSPQKVFAEFYMNLDGELVRESDKQIRDMKEGNTKVTQAMCKEFINRFNALQKTCGWFGTKKRVSVNENKSQMVMRMQTYYCNSFAVN